MRKLAVWSAVGLFVVGSVTAAFSCPCRLGRGIRLDRAYTAPRPAWVLIYAGAQNSKSALGNAKLQATLKQTGHKIETVDNPTALEQELKSGKFDIVLTEYADALALAERVTAETMKAAIIPVMAKATKAQINAATKQFTYLVKSPGDAIEYLVMIDQAMKARLVSRT